MQCSQCSILIEPKISREYFNLSAESPTMAIRTFSELKSAYPMLEANFSTSQFTAKPIASGANWLLPKSGGMLDHLLFPFKEYTYCYIYTKTSCTQHHTRCLYKLYHSSHTSLTSTTDVLYFFFNDPVAVADPVYAAVGDEEPTYLPYKPKTPPPSSNYVPYRPDLPLLVRSNSAAIYGNVDAASAQPPLPLPFAYGEHSASAPDLTRLGLDDSSNPFSTAAALPTAAVTPRRGRLPSHSAPSSPPLGHRVLNSGSNPFAPEMMRERTSSLPESALSKQRRGTGSTPIAASPLAQRRASEFHCAYCSDLIETAFFQPLGDKQIYSNSLSLVALLDEFTPLSNPFYFTEFNGKLVRKLDDAVTTPAVIVQALNENNPFAVNIDILKKQMGDTTYIDDIVIAKVEGQAAAEWIHPRCLNRVATDKNYIKAMRIYLIR